MVKILARDKAYMAYATGADLTAIDNGQVKLAVGELNAIDWLISAEFIPTVPKTERHNPMTSGFISKRLPAGREIGTFTATYHLQTGIPTHLVMMNTTTTEGSPDDHNLNRATATNVIKSAFHIEKEGTTSNLRWDLLLFIPISLDIYVSEKITLATQVLTGMYGFSYDDADELVQPTKFTQAALRPLTWYDLKHASSNSEFQYNNGDINVDITDIHIHIGWQGFEFGTYDNPGYPTDGWIIPPFNAYADIVGRRIDAGDTDIKDIVKTVSTSYAGDLDFIADFYRAADHRLQYTFDKMFIDPKTYKEITPTETEWQERVKFKLEFLDENSSLVGDEQNELNDDYYENP